MLLRGIFPKLYRRNLPLDVQVNRGVDITSRAITLVETLQINRLSAFWWSCEFLPVFLHQVLDNRFDARQLINRSRFRFQLHTYWYLHGKPQETLSRHNTCKVLG